MSEAHESPAFGVPLQTIFFDLTRYYASYVDHLYPNKVLNANELTLVTPKHALNVLSGFRKDFGGSLSPAQEAQILLNNLGSDAYVSAAAIVVDYTAALPTWSDQDMRSFVGNAIQREIDMLLVLIGNEPAEAKEHTGARQYYIHNMNKLKDIQSKLFVLVSPSSPRKEH